MKRPSRRAAVKALGAIGATLSLPLPTNAKNLGLERKVKLGMIADLHGGLATDAKARLEAFLAAMQLESCDALVQLGDFAFPNPANQEFADSFNQSHETTIHVIGNHEFDFGLTRQDCYRAWSIESSYYRRDVGGVRILVLDGNETGSPNHRGGYPSFIGQQQQKWLEQELSGSTKPLLILSHQPLAGTSAIDNATSLQQLLARFRDKIILCINGHSHVDSLIQVDGVPYLHLNSASYYWVGGKERMAYYSDPLFTTVTIDPSSASVQVKAKSGKWKGKSPRAIGYFDRDKSPPEQIVTPRIRPHHVSKTELKIMTWNIWGKLNQDPRYTVNDQTARQRTTEIIQNSGVDVVAMIEAYGSAAEIASELGFHFHTPSQAANLCLLSRYPLSDVDLLPGLNPFSFIAATVSLPGGQTVRVYDVWLTSAGRHIVKIKDASISDVQFAAGDDNRFQHLQELLNHSTFKQDLARTDSVPLIVAGDFNCVSHLDHTPETREHGLNHSRVLSIKASKAMQQLGFDDSYRTVHPQIKETTLGHTWTTVGQDYRYESGKGFVPTTNHPEPQYQECYARIDYIYSRGKSLKPVDSTVIPQTTDRRKLKFPAFPSDHAAVVTTFRVNRLKPGQVRKPQSAQERK